MPLAARTLKALVGTTCAFNHAGQAYLIISKWSLVWVFAIFRRKRGAYV